MEYRPRGVWAEGLVSASGAADMEEERPESQPSHERDSGAAASDDGAADVIHAVSQA